MCLLLCADLAGGGALDRAAGGNTADAIFGLELAYIIGPIVFVMLGGACVLGWKLDAAKHADIRVQLERRDALYAEAPILETFGAEPPIPVLAEEGKG